MPCLARQAVESTEMSVADPERREELVRLLLREIADSDWREAPVNVSQRMQRRVRDFSGRADPYRALKTRMNDAALALLPALAQEARRRPDPREAAVRLAIAGNLLDAGSKNRLTPEELPAMLDRVWDLPLSGDVAELFREVESAQRILYLADNAGEIIFDRLLVEALPRGRVTLAVRGVPVLNDATLEDAAVAGLHQVAEVIDNGSDAPGTVLAETSPAFQRIFKEADLIISKGQGNFETLSDTSANVYFLLTVKCPAIGAAVGAPVGALVVKPASELNRSASA
ncbi:MAG: DUF89 family protein [Lentisphaerae bacterium]|jgi:uncharacterized protein with ATP-grasp and redox domains|nr:DUF89 family protein [Lentisphaerota bacterium]